MALRSRKIRERTVSVTSSDNPDEQLQVTIRALRPTEMQWLVERNPGLWDEDDESAPIDERVAKVNTATALGFTRDLVRLGLVDLPDPPLDPDTGKPFAIRRYTARVAGEKAQLVANDTLDALADYLFAIAGEIGEMAALTAKEKDAARPTSASTGTPALAVAEDAEGTLPSA